MCSKPIFCSKIAQKEKNCWVTRTAKKLLQEPKVAQKLPSTIGTGLLVVVLPSVTDVFTPVILNWFANNINSYSLSQNGWDLSETVACEQPLHLGESREITREPHAFSFGSLRSPLEMGSLLAGYFIAACSPER